MAPRAPFDLNIGPQFATEPCIGPRAAADIDREALDRVRVVILGDLHGEQADIADVVLGAGVVTARRVDVERRVERQPAFGIAPR